MNLNKDQLSNYFSRIDQVLIDDNPRFGEMNAHQMICHCTDFFRMAFGTKRAEEYGVVDPDEIKAMVRLGQNAPTPKGFGQIEGQGTVPREFEADKKMLKDHIQQFAQLNKDFVFAEHPYFGHMDLNQWRRLTIYHLDHHLNQFNV